MLRNEHRFRQLGPDSGPGQVLRSRPPDGVEQEVWAHLLVHHAIRSLMHTAATDAGLDPDRLSFIRGLRLARRQTTRRPLFSLTD